MNIKLLSYVIFGLISHFVFAYVLTMLKQNMFHIQLKTDISTTKSRIKIENRKTKNKLGRGINDLSESTLGDNFKDVMDNKPGC